MTVMSVDPAHLLHRGRRNLLDATTMRRTGYSYTEEKASYENGLSCSYRDECGLCRSVLVPVGVSPYGRPANSVCT
jgi:hypothetical protein